MVPNFTRIEICFIPLSNVVYAIEISLTNRMKPCQFTHDASKIGIGKGNWRPAGRFESIYLESWTSSDDGDRLGLFVRVQCKNGLIDLQSVEIPGIT